jgi:hypothetical protein
MNVDGLVNDGCVYAMDGLVMGGWVCIGGG